MVLLYIIFAVAMVVGVWSLVIMCKCVGEVSLFSAWRGFGAMLLAGLLIAVPIFVIAMLFFVVFSVRA